MKKITLLLTLTLFSIVSFSQITLCNNATPICGSLTFANTTNLSSYGHIGCLGSTPNSHWSIFKVGQSGNLVFSLKQGNNAPNYNNLDIDYICWGPFNDIPNCNSQLYGFPVGNTAIPNNVIGCSYSAAATETVTVNNAVSGKYYVILSTNYSNQAGTIVLTQTNTASPGAGNTICDYAVVNDAPDDITYQSTANFSVSTLNVNAYRWQMSSNGTDWTDLFDGGTNPTISGSATNSLNLTDVPVTYIDYYFRVNLTTTTENVNSNYARITGTMHSNSFDNISNEISITNENITIGKLTGTVKIFDINGRTLITKEITPNSNINISSYSKGIYILNFEDSSNNTNYNKKFIKN